MNAPRTSSRLICLLALAVSACGSSEVTFSEHIYRTIEQRELAAHVFSPATHWWAPDRAAIVVLHGGAWKRGGPESTYSYCRYFAARGMVAIAAQYRLSDGASVTPLEAIEDARELIRWVRENAADLAVDPARIAVGGWSSGGHLAAMTALAADEPEKARSSVPDALLLWFPSLAPHNDPVFLELMRGDVEAATLSPVLRVRKGLPPTVIFQGSRDRTTPPAPARRFCEQMKANGDRCDLHEYKHRGHTFTQRMDDYVDTLIKADTFLASLGFLAGKPDPEAAKRFRDQDPL